MINKEVMKNLIKMSTGVEITDEALDLLKEKNKPKTIEELLIDPFAKDYCFLIGQAENRPRLVNSMIDSRLDSGYKGELITVEDIHSYSFDELEWAEGEDKELIRKEIEETFQWLLKHRYGSMCLDW